MAINRFSKDPDAVLDYTVDWATWLGADTIATSDWTVPSGITEDSASNDTTSATIWLSGGTVGATYRVQNRITTAAGRTVPRSIFVAVLDR